MKEDINFAAKIKTMREQKGISIKTLAKSLDVNYTYLSKIENSKSVPSEAFIERLAKVFNYDADELKIMAGKIPDDVIEILKNNPLEAIIYLRREFGGKSDPN